LLSCSASLTKVGQPLQIIAYVSFVVFGVHFVAGQKQITTFPKGEIQRR
jgi:hypothetical protein